MDAAIKTLQNPLMEGIDLCSFRTPETLGENPLLSGGHIISADGHWEVHQDIFYERIPHHLKERAPRVWFEDSYIRIDLPENRHARLSPRLAAVMSEAFTPGLYDLELRLKHMELEGVDRELVFPHSLLWCFGLPDLEVREWVFRIYNEYLAERGREIPGKFFGVGVVSNWWDPSRAPSAIQQIADLGLKAMMLPIKPGKDLNGEDVNWGSEAMEPLMQAIAQSGIPLCFHVGENMDVEGRGKYGGYLMDALDPFRKGFGQLVFGGVFDRNPTLKVVYVEGGLSWIPTALQDAEMIFDSYGKLMSPLPKERPSHYWKTNLYATFQNDLLGLELLDYLGADRVMWGSDYPHPEGAYGFNYSSRQSVLDATSPEMARKILGDNARAVFKL